MNSEEAADRMLELLPVLQPTNQGTSTQQLALAAKLLATLAKIEGVKVSCSPYVRVRGEPPIRILYPNTTWCLWFDNQAGLVPGVDLKPMKNFLWGPREGPARISLAFALPQAPGTLDLQLDCFYVDAAGVYHVWANTFNQSGTYRHVMHGPVDINLIHPLGPRLDTTKPDPPVRVFESRVAEYSSIRLQNRLNQLNEYLQFLVSKAG